MNNKQDVVEQKKMILLQRMSYRPKHPDFYEIHLGEINQGKNLLFVLKDERLANYIVNGYNKLISEQNPEPSVATGDAIPDAADNQQIPLSTVKELDKWLLEQIIDAESAAKEETEDLLRKFLYGVISAFKDVRVKLKELPTGSLTK